MKLLLSLMLISGMCKAQLMKMDFYTHKIVYRKTVPEKILYCSVHGLPLSKDGICPYSKASISKDMADTVGHEFREEHFVRWFAFDSTSQVFNTTRKKK